MQGVSVVICCHNGVGRIEETLRHLEAQEVRSDLPWEVVVVDNASTDNTAAAAANAWTSSRNSVPFRLIREDKLGLANARKAGINAARHDLVSFVDDDNWVESSWVTVVAEIFRDHAEVGACGGYNTPTVADTAPRWLSSVAGAFAIGPQAARSGDVSRERGFLFGAGLSLRRAAWMDITSPGCEPYLTDRQGQRLNSGGDQELCYRLLLTGWRLWYDERLRLRHHISPNRLTWPYVRQLHRAFGRTWVWLDPYQRLLKQRGLLSGAPPSDRWWIELTVAGRRWARQAASLLARARWGREGDPGVLWLDMLSGRIGELLRQRRLYARSMSQVQTAFAAPLLGPGRTRAHAGSATP